MVLGLVAIYVAARGHLSGLRQSFVESEKKSVRTDLKQRARERVKELDERMRRGEVVAVYTREGELLEPSPPRTVRPWRVPDHSVATEFVRRGDYKRALRYARTSPEKAYVYLRLGVRNKDPEMMRRALAEPALAGTDMYYQAELSLFSMEQRQPTKRWLDEVSAMLGGRSDSIAKVLLKRANAEPVGNLATRIRYAQLQPRAGYFQAGDDIFMGEQRAYRSYVRKLAIADLHEGQGDIAVAMPKPFAMVTVRGRVDPAAVDADLNPIRRRLAVFYVIAAALLVGGTVYSYVAIGRFYRAAKAKSEFVANVTHELKTPIANIRLYGETLQSGRVREEDRAEFLQTILDESKRLEELVEGLLHAARGPQLRMESIDVTALLLEAEARWRKRLEDEGYAFVVEAPELPSVKGDRESLLRAISNLVDNARKYSVNDRRITLRGSAQNGAVRLTILDRGPGIPVRARHRVLKPFTRIESADRKETAGTGLGLSLVVACMEAHGGKITIGSAPDKGTAVTLELPVEEPNR